MQTLLQRLLAALAFCSLLYSGAALAGLANSAGTLLGEEKLGTDETIGPLIVLAVIAVALVVYLRRRK
jgi:hypothetical protein